MIDATNSFLPKPIAARVTRQDIKVATPDLILGDENISSELMQEYIFALIGGQELLSSTRHDLIGSPLSKGSSMISDSGSSISLQSTQTKDNLHAMMKSNLLDVNDYDASLITDINVKFDATIKKLVITFNGIPSRYVVDVQFILPSNTDSGTMYRGVI